MDLEAHIWHTLIESENNESVDFIVMAGSMPVAIGMVMDWNTQCPWISNLAVARGHRSKGIGTKLVRTMIEYVTKAHTAETVLIYVHKDNPAKRMYEREGFTVCGECAKGILRMSRCLDRETKKCQTESPKLDTGVFRLYLFMGIFCLLLLLVLICIVVNRQDAVDPLFNVWGLL